MLGRLLETRLIQDPAWARWGAGSDLHDVGSPRVNDQSAMQLLAVYSATKVISETIATLPVDVYRKLPDGRREEVKNPPAWVKNPTPDLSAVEWFSQILVSMLLRGNAYALLVRDASGAVVELHPLHPDWVQVRREQFTASASLKAYFVNGEFRPSDRILHIPTMMAPGSLVGVDPITMARDAITLGLEAQSYGSAFFRNSAIPAGVISSPGRIELTQAKELAEQWRQMHSGKNRAHLPAVLSNGATYTPITVTAEQAQFLETRRYTDEQIFRLFGLGNPLQTDQGQSITYANMEQISSDVAKYALQPLTDRVEQALTALLPRPQYLKFNFDAFLRTDTKGRYDAYAVGITNKFLTVNEAREKEDLPPLEEEPAPEPPPEVPPLEPQLELDFNETVRTVTLIRDDDGFPSAIEERVHVDS